VNPFLAQDPATKSRRLARALISDLVVYHPAKRAEGLRDGTLKLLFEDEIRKCWAEYSEQVGMEMATSTRYFTEALNEILADGQPVFS
jgi:capsid protein